MLKLGACCLRIGCLVRGRLAKGRGRRCGFVTVALFGCCILGSGMCSSWTGVWKSIDSILLFVHY